MVKVKLKIIGLPQRGDLVIESTLDVKNIWEIIQRMESKYPQDYYTFNIFLNGRTVDDNVTDLSDGDEVVIVPIMSGG